jgi:hypothetical protein
MNRMLPLPCPRYVLLPMSLGRTESVLAGRKGFELIGALNHEAKGS